MSSLLTKQEALRAQRALLEAQAEEAARANAKERDSIVERLVADYNSEIVKKPDGPLDLYLYFDMDLKPGAEDAVKLFDQKLHDQEWKLLCHRIFVEPYNPDPELRLHVRCSPKDYHWDTYINVGMYSGIFALLCIVGYVVFFCKK